MIARILSRTSLRFLLWLLVASAYFPAATVNPYDLPLLGDAHYHAANDEAGRRSFAEHGQIPHWNPYNCGGVPGLANPETTYLAPDFALRVLFGTDPGRRLAVLLFVLLGLEGMFRLGRFYRLSATGAVCAAMVFSTMGVFTHHVDRGWLNMMPFELMPWVLLGFEEGRAHWRWRFVGAAALAWMALCGGTYSVPYTLVLLGVVTAARLAQALTTRGEDGSSRWQDVLASSATIVAMALAISAAKSLPLMAAIHENPRKGVAHFGYPFVGLVRRLIIPTGGKNVPDTYNYIGSAACILAFIPLLTGSRRARAFWLGAAFFMILAMGHFAPWAPCSLLEKLPIFGQLRWPYRYLMVVVVFLSLSAGVAVTQIEELPTRLARWWRARRDATKPSRRATDASLGLLGSILGLATALAVGGTVVKDTRIKEGRVYQMPGPEAADLEFFQARGNRWDAHVWPSLNIGSLVCITGVPVKQSGSLRPDLRAEEYPLDPSLASVRRISWSPNRIDLEVKAKERTVVVVNQNHHRGWSSSTGSVIDHEGLLAVEVPEGEHRLTLAYTTPLWGPSLTISLLALLGLVVVAGLSIRQRLARHVAIWRELPFWPGSSTGSTRCDGGDGV